MNGKGSKPRPIRDYKALGREWDRIFKRKKTPPAVDKRPVNKQWRSTTSSAGLKKI